MKIILMESFETIDKRGKKKPKVIKTLNSNVIGFRMV